MREIFLWVNSLLCLFGFFALIGIVNSPFITKGEFIGVLGIWICLVLVSITLYKRVVWKRNLLKQ
jgi:hypothetical protein